MKINPFILERHFALYEFSVRYQLSPSDCEALKMKELLDYSDNNEKELWNNLNLGYTESKGFPKLRQSISEKYRDISAEDVITCVPEEGIFIALNSLLDRKDHVIILTPIYQSLIEIPRAIGCSITEWELQRSGRQWELDIDLLKRSIRKNTKMVIINFPHNPTGFLPSLAVFKELISIVQEKNIILFSDEMYRGLEYNQDKKLPSACEMDIKSVILSGLSKSYGLPGLRMGWLITKNQDWMVQFQLYKDYTTICGSASAEILSLIALRNSEKIIIKNREIVNQNLCLTRDFFDTHQEYIEWIEPFGSSVLFPELKSDIEDFACFCLKKYELLMITGKMFFMDGDYFRIGIGRKSFSETLKIFEKAFLDYFRNE